MNAILGQKLGMTQVFDDDARAIPVTVIKAGPCHVVQVKRPEIDGYSAVQISFGDVKPNRVNKPQAGHFAKAGVAPTRNLVEIRVDDVDGYEVGSSPPSFDKQFVRDYLDTLDWDKTAPGPELPAEILERTAEKYREALTRMTRA